MGRDIPLEAVRGFAALAVVAGHIALGLSPTLVLRGSDADAWLLGGPWFVLMNGRAAVNLFFVLSAFVLTRQYLVTGDDSIIIRGAFKRWPRLAAPVLVAVIASWALLNSGLYFYQSAAQLTHSTWLAGGGFSFREGLSALDGSLRSALAEGAVLTFFRGNDSYISVLWSMHWEFIGSFIAFGLAMAFMRMKAIPVVASITLFGTVMLMCHFARPELVAFPIGVALAALIPREPAVTTVGALSGLLVSIFLLGYSGQGVGLYRELDAVDFVHRHVDFVNIVGAATVISLVETCGPIRTVLSLPGMAVLGRLSFPIYLLHVPILCSAGCATLLWTSSHLWAYPYACAVAVTIIATIVSSVLLMWLNETWVDFLNRNVAKLFTKHESIGAPAFRKTL